MTLFKQVPSTEIVAVCDVYEPRRAEALKIAGADAQTYVEYREVLDRKDVDAVHAGKDAYFEKPIMHSIEEGVEMMKAVEETKRVVQTGTQQRSWDHWILGKQIVDSGKLGKITFVHTYWYQNYYAPNEWNALPEIDTSKLEWKKFLGDAPDPIQNP